MFAFMCPCMHAYMHADSHVFIYPSVRLSVCLSVCLYVCIYVCMYVCIVIFFLPCRLTSVYIWVFSYHGASYILVRYMVNYNGQSGINLICNDQLDAPLKVGT